MKVFFRWLCCFSLVLGVSGCFPMAAPERLPVYDDIAEARGVAEPLELDLSEQDLRGIPDGLDLIPRLVRLRLRGNVLGALGEEIALLAHVPWVDMGRAGVQSLPAEVATLQALQRWWLSDNALTALPDGITALAALRYLNLDRNQLTDLPEGVGALASLRWLRLNGNRLTQLPDSITELAALERLYLAYNQISVLPENMGALTQLDTLVLTGNPMEADELARVREALPDCNVVFRVRDL